MDLGLAGALGNLLKRTRTAYDDVVRLAQQGQALAQLTIDTVGISRLGDQAFSAGAQILGRVSALDNHNVNPRVNNLGTGPLSSPTTGSLTNLTGADRNLLNHAARAGSSDRVQGGTGQLPTDKQTNKAATSQRLYELNTEIDYTPTTTTDTSRVTAADNNLFGRGPSPAITASLAATVSARRLADLNTTLSPTPTPPTGWAGYAQLPGGEFDGIANPGPNPNPTVDLNAAIAAVSNQFNEPLPPVREVDVRTAEIGEIRSLLEQADRLVAAGGDIPDSMAYARSGLAEEAIEIRREAWDRVEAFGGEPQVVLGYVINTDATDREIANATELARAQRLHETADALTDPRFALEVADMRSDSEGIMSDLFLTSETSNVVDQLGSTLSPYETVAVIGYAKIAEDGGQAVIDSTNPMRVLEVMGQGYTERVALDHVANAPATGLGAKTFAELEGDLATMEAANDTNRYEFDATLAELNERSQAISGEIYVRTELEAVRISDRAGFGYGDSLAIVIDGRLENVSDHPGARSAQMDEIQRDLELLVEVRQQEAVDERNAIYEFAVDPVAPMGDPAEQANRLLAIIGAGASVGQAEAFNNTIPETATDRDAVQLTRQINNLVDDGEDVNTAAGLAIAAFENDIDLADVVRTAEDEPDIDLITAFNLHYAADRRDMTIAEFQAYQGIIDRETFDAIDNAQAGDLDGKISIEDLNHVINDPNADPEVVAAAQAFLNSPDLMARLDTGRDFSENVVDHESFGRDRVDDQLWSREDIDSFELKQDLNFALSGLVDKIDTAGQGGVTDGHLSKQDFQAVLDDADELGLSDEEVDALTTVINGKLYDQHWVERNRDSLAIAAAVVAGTAIFVATGGVGAGLSLALVGSVAAGTAGAGVTAGVVTGGINAFTQEDLTDGVAGNAFKGAIVGGLAAPGLATGGAGWAGAGMGGRLLIGVGFAGEGAGLVGAGALDWAIDPFYDGDSIDMNNLHSDADRYSLLLAGGSAVASVGSVVGRKLAVDSVTETLDLAESEFVRQLDAVVPPTGTMYSGSTTRLNNPAFGTERALDPTAYKESFTGTQIGSSRVFTSAPTRLPQRPRLLTISTTFPDTCG